jgi:protein-tyrosine phosphatase
MSRIPSVKMAAEIDLPCDVSVPTEDFSVPDKDAMIGGLWRGVRLLKATGHLFVGCAGGRGRTGLYMACLARLMEMDGYPVGDSVDYVRRTYNPHAVETSEQRAWVYNLQLRWLHAAMGLPFVKG